MRERLPFKNQRYYFYIIENVLQGLPIPKPMRWGDGDIEFARPIHWILLRYGHEVLSGAIKNVTTGSLSYGHRFHHPEAITISKVEGYEKTIRKCFCSCAF